MSPDPPRSEVRGLRVSCLIGTLHPGGAERVLVRVAEWLLAEGAHVEIVTMTPQGPTDLVPGSGIIRSALARPEGSSLRRRAILLGRLRKALLAERPDVVLSFLTETNLAALATLAGSGVPVVVSERVDFRQHPVPSLVRGLRDVLYRRAAAVVVQTEELGEWVFHHRSGWNGCVIPNPVVPTAEGIRPAWLPADRRVLLGMGRLEGQKGFDVLVDAFGRVAPDYPDWDLIIAGEGPDRVALEAEVNERGLAGRVRLPGRVDPPWGLVHAADVFVLPSRYEGFPNALAEAMAAGVPSVATDCPTGPRDLLRHGHDGFLVGVDDPGALAVVLAQLMANPALRARLGAQATEVLERYAPDWVLPRWGKVLADAAASG